MFLFSQQRSIIFRLLFLRIRANVRLTARPRVVFRHFTTSIRARVSLRFRFARAIPVKRKRNATAGR